MKTKYFRILFLILCMVFTVLPVKVHANLETKGHDHDLFLLENVEHKTSVPSGYTGIYTVSDLKALQGSDATKNYILMNDLDLSGQTWTPIKFKSTDYKGTFDGNGYTIKNFNADTSDHIALFDDNEGMIRNLRISGEIHISYNMLGQRNAASIVLENEGTIFNCTSSVDFISERGTEIHMGGIAVNNFGTISHCRYTGTMKAIKKAYANFGGIAYDNNYKSETYIGDKIGIIEYCECIGNMDVLIGNPGEMDYEVTDLIELRIGGICGISSVHSSINVCRYTGNIYVAGTFNRGYIYAGGITGKNDGSDVKFDNCCFTGKIRFNCTYEKNQPSFFVGGIMGQGGADTINHSFVSGEILDEGMILGAPGWFYGHCANHTENRGIANYYPSGSLDVAASGFDTGFDGFMAVPLASMSSKSTFAGFDFNNIWTMTQSNPIQRVFTQLYSDETTPDPTPTPDPGDDIEIDAEEYILQHLEFIHSNEYETRSQLRFSKLMEDCMDSPDQNTAETAYKILNTINDISKFKLWSIFENQYEAVIVELITSCAMEEYDTISFKMEAESLTISNNVWKLLNAASKGKYEAPEYKTNIQKLLKYPSGLEEENPNLYNELKGAMDYYFVQGQDKADMIKAISDTTDLYGKINDFIAVVNDIDSAVEWISELHNFKCTVEALHELTHDQINAFRSLDSYIEQSAGSWEAGLFSAAYEKYDNYLTKDHIGAVVFEEGVFSFGELTFDILTPFISAIMTDCLVTAFHIPASVASKAMILIAAYQAGWAIGNAVTHDDKIMASCDLLHANAKIEEALYQMVKQKESALDQQKTFQSAKEFDAAWMLLRASEKYAVSVYKDMLEAMQSSMKSKFLTIGRVDIYGTSKADEITLANYEYIKWDNAICHGQKMHDRLSGNLGKINTLNVSGVKEFCLSDISGMILVDVIEDEIAKNVPYITVDRVGDGFSVSLAGDMDVVIALYDDEEKYINFEVVTVNDRGEEINRTTFNDIDASEGAWNICQYDDESADIDIYTYDDDDDYYYGVEIIPDEYQIVAGGSYSLDVVLDPEIEDEEVMWWSEDEDIATVDQNGNVKTYKAGSTFINATAGAEEHTGFSYLLSMFKDVTDSNLSYFDPVYWALYREITTGTSPVTFSPGKTCTRAQFVTFLWRMEDCPEPQTTKNPFKDVKQGMSYSKAVLWAYENGITTGTSPTTFSPDKPCTRAQVVTFLWRSCGETEPETTVNPFKDVKPGLSYSKAVLWAYEYKITTGTDATHFSPGAACTRAQTVTFLYRV